MYFPETIIALAAAGYTFKKDGRCGGCRLAIEWWETPKGKMMPVEVDTEGNCKSHFATCPMAGKFRRR